MNVREATKICFLRYLSEFNLPTELAILSQKAIDEIDSYPIDKLNRWLGFIQGYLIFNKLTTVDNERDFSRPLFHEAYKTEGIIIPPKFSVN